MDSIVYKKIMCSLTLHSFWGKCTIFQQPNIIFPRAAYRRLQVYGVFGHPNIWAKYEGGEVQRPNHSRTQTHSRTTQSLCIEFDYGLLKRFIWHPILEYANNFVTVIVMTFWYVFGMDLNFFELFKLLFSLGIDHDPPCSLCSHDLCLFPFSYVSFFT